jgi:hypothetical protein
MFQLQAQKSSTGNPGSSQGQPGINLHRPASRAFFAAITSANVITSGARAGFALGFAAHLTPDAVGAGVVVVVSSAAAGCSPARVGGAGAGALLGATGAIVAGAKVTGAIVAARAAVAAAAAADLAVARSAASASLAALAQGLTLVHYSAQRKHFLGE